MDRHLTRVLIAYSSGSGCTKTIARHIGEVLIGHGFRPQVVDTQDHPIITDKVDAIIFGSGVRVGKWHREGAEWLKSNSDLIKNRPLAVFSVGLLGVHDEEHKLRQAQVDLLKEIKRLKPLEPVASAIFPGWKEPERFASVERLMLKVYPLEDGDYRDWNQVDFWVQEIAPLLRQTHHSS